MNQNMCSKESTTFEGCVRKKFCLVAETLFQRRKDNEEFIAFLVWKIMRKGSQVEKAKHVSKV